MFESAEQALQWSAEVLRRRRWPKLSSFWRDLDGEADSVAMVWEGEKLMGLPEDAEGRLGLALGVEKALADVARRDAAAAALLRIWAWGDWADEGRLRRALAVQEKCRREGLRVRVAYRYTYAQLAQLLGCDRKTAWRKVQVALALMVEALAARKLVVRVEVPELLETSFKKDVHYSDF